MDQVAVVSAAVSVRWFVEEQGTVLRVVLDPGYRNRELLSAFEHALANQELRLPVRVLLDARQSTAAPDHNELRARASFITNRPDVFATRVAVLVRDRLRFGLVRVAAAYAEASGSTVRAFYDEPQARRWLSQPDRRNGAH